MTATIRIAVSLLLISTVGCAGFRAHLRPVLITETKDFVDWDQELARINEIYRTTGIRFAAAPPYWLTKERLLEGQFAKVIGTSGPEAGVVVLSRADGNEVEEIKVAVGPAWSGAKVAKELAIKLRVHTHEARSANFGQDGLLVTGKKWRIEDSEDGLEIAIGKSCVGQRENAVVSLTEMIAIGVLYGGDNDKYIDVFFVDSELTNCGWSGFAFPAAGQKDVGIKNVVFISAKSSAGNVLSHEVGHVLLDNGAHQHSVDALMHPAFSGELLSYEEVSRMTALGHKGPRTILKPSWWRRLFRSTPLVWEVPMKIARCGEKGECDPLLDSKELCGKLALASKESLVPIEFREDLLRALLRYDSRRTHKLDSTCQNTAIVRLVEGWAIDSCGELPFLAALFLEMIRPPSKFEGYIERLLAGEQLEAARLALLSLDGLPTQAVLDMVSETAEQQKDWALLSTLDTLRRREALPKQTDGTTLASLSQWCQRNQAVVSAVERELARLTVHDGSGDPLLGGNPSARWALSFSETVEHCERFSPFNFLRRDSPVLE